MDATILFSLYGVFLGIVSCESKIGVKLCIERCSNTGKCSSVQFDQTHLQCRLLWTGSFPDQSEYVKNKIDVKASTNPSLNCERDHRIVTTAWGKIVCLKGEQMITLHFPRTLNLNSETRNFKKASSALVGNAVVFPNDNTSYASQSLSARGRSNQVGQKDMKKSKGTVRIRKVKKCKPKTSRPYYNKKSKRCVKGCSHFSHQFTIFRNSKTYESSYEKVKAASLSDCRNACVALRKFTCITFSCSERMELLFSNDCYLGKRLPSRLKKQPPLSYSIETKWYTGIRDRED